MNRDIGLGRTTTIAMLTPYSLALFIFFIDITYIFKTNIVVTVGRVSMVGHNIYLFTGSLLFDKIFFWMLIVFSSSALSNAMKKPSNRFILPTISFLGLITTSVIDSKWLFISLALVSIATMFIAIVGAGFVKELIYSIAIVIAMIESIKIIYLLVKLIAGIYPIFTTPIYINTTFWYYLWPLTPITLIVITVYGVFRIISKLLNIEVSIRFKVMRLYNKIKNIVSTQSAEDGLMSRGLHIYLLAGLVLSIAMGLIPYAPTLNTGQRPVNVDWIYYYSWLNSMANNDFSVLASRSDRSLYLLLLYIVWFISGVDPRALALYHNIALFPLYTFSLYLLARRLLGEKVAGYTALLTPFSPILLSFIYGGFQANLFAISLVYLSLYLLAGSRREILSGLVILFMVMFIHEWTWTQYTFILTGYVALRLIGRTLNKWSLEWRDKAIIYYLIASYIADISKNIVFNMFSATKVVETAVKVKTMPYIDSLHFYTTIYTGGTLNNPLFYVMALLGLCSLGLDIPSLATTLSLVPALAPWSYITYRLILNTPITILVAKSIARQKPLMRALLVVLFAGIALWRLYTIIPGLSLTP